MNHFALAAYEKKFADFIRMCAELKAQGITQVMVATPAVFGDTHEELIESWSRLADAGLSLNIAARQEPPNRN